MENEYLEQEQPVKELKKHPIFALVFLVIAALAFVTSYFITEESIKLFTSLFLFGAASYVIAHNLMYMKQHFSTMLTFSLVIYGLISTYAYPTDLCFAQYPYLVFAFIMIQAINILYKTIKHIYMKEDMKLNVLVLILVCAVLLGSTLLLMLGMTEVITMTQATTAMLSFNFVVLIYGTLNAILIIYRNKKDLESNN